MSTFSLNRHPSPQREVTVRTGSISVFALIVIVCLAVLAVLTVSTAHSSLVLSQRQAAATQELYANETAAQAFLAELDDVLATADDNALATLAPRLDAMSASAEAIARGQVDAAAHLEGERVEASFSCVGGRTLLVTATILADNTYRIDRWRMTAIENEEQPLGTLYTGA